jgi:hypothetical protein
MFYPNFSTSSRSSTEKVLCINRSKVRQSNDIVEISGKADDELTFICFTSKELKLYEGITVLLVDDKFNSSFSHSGQVIDVEVTVFKQGLEDIFKDYIDESGSIPSKRVRTEFSIRYERLKRENDEDYLVSNYAYSLPFVNNFDDPIRDFPKIKWISFEDYETVVEKKIFISRTAFGYLINALPFENRWELATAIRQRFNTQTPYISDYTIAFEIVADFIRQKVYRTGKLLIGSYEIARELPIDNFPVDRLGFSSPTPPDQRFVSVVDNLKNQQTRFRELLEYDEKQKFFNTVFEAISQNSDREREFNSRFQDIPWPINLL